MRLEGLATWDGGNSTWGGWARGIGTVPVCVSVQERAGVRDGFWQEKELWVYYLGFRIMSSIIAQQAKLDLELVPKEKRLKIGKCNERLNPRKIHREPIFQVVLDTLALTPCYSAFLITTDVLEVSMH
nr:hypothetical protein [Tanacetum cinerariifolium]